MREHMVMMHQHHPVLNVVARVRALRRNAGLRTHAF